MGLKAIGVGLGRTGTTSLRDALSRLLDGPCYHFEDVISNPSHVALWSRALDGQLSDWEEIYGPYVATTDWPGAAFWRELSEAYPDAMIVLSTRRTTSEWFDSVQTTIQPLMTREAQDPEEEWHLMTQELLRRRFIPAPFPRSETEAAYERHNAAVRESIDASRLIEWSPGDGWEPLCKGLDLPVPADEFPHLNTRSEFQESLSKAAATLGGAARRPLGRTVLERLRDLRSKRS